MYSTPFGKACACFRNICLSPQRASTTVLRGSCSWLAGMGIYCERGRYLSTYCMLPPPSPSPSPNLESKFPPPHLARGLSTCPSEPPPSPKPSIKPSIPTPLHGPNLTGSLGKSVASLTLFSPRKNCNMRFKPNPPPPWGGHPYLKAAT